jgi:hypothetical protein
MEKRKFLQRYIETAELLGVSLTVEHLLPCLIEIVITHVNHPECSLSKTLEAATKKRDTSS